ncbi:MAG: hypothetical protein JNN04_05165 [Cyclobacteriaceae bacterium]|nr:hypothetical protein [Cyclobacteriaceae bacterium]
MKRWSRIWAGTITMWLLAVTTSLAQTEGTLYFMNSLPQVVEANPALVPRYKTAIGLPGISSFGGVYSNNGFTADQFITKVNGVSAIDLTGWTQSLAEKNYVNVAGFADLFRVGLRVNPKWYVMASSTVKQYSSAMIPKGLASAFVDGTSTLVNSYSNTSPQVEMLSYLQTALGASYQVNGRLTVGGRIKFLNGLANVTTERSSMIVEVDNNYRMTLTGDALVKTAGIPASGSTDYQLGENLGNNHGWGLDLGVSYNAVERLQLSAAINDVGFISWGNNIRSYSLDPSKAQYVFSGFDVNQLLDDNSGYLRQQLDSLEAKFKMTETPSGSYTTSLPSRYYLAARYELVPKLWVGTLFFGEGFRDRFAAGMTASLNKDFGNWLSASFTYTVSNRSYNNIGAGLSFNLSPVQFYILGDNLLMAPATLVAGDSFNDYLNNSQLLTVRAGLNLVFGWDRTATSKSKPSNDAANPKKQSKKTKTKTTFGRSPQKK